VEPVRPVKEPEGSVVRKTPAVLAEILTVQEALVAKEIGD
jgi:hypothetical protein